MEQSKTIRKAAGRSTVAGGALLLALTGFIAKILGAVYRIPLTNILGAEGIGMYQLIFPIYALILTLSSGAIPTAMARMIAEKNTLGEKDSAASVFAVSTILLCVAGVVASIALFLLASPLARLQGISGLRFGYIAIAPSVLIVAVTSSFKAWFQGNMNMRPSSAAQLVEQVVKMAAGLALASVLIKRSMAAAVTGALIGVTLSELVSFFVMLALYYRHGGKLKLSGNVEYKRYSGEILKLSVPIFLSGLIFPLSHFIDSLLIVNVLEFSGATNAEATAMYGLLTGPVSSLINLPVIVALSLAVVVIPVISKGRVQLDAEGIKRKSAISLKLTYFIGIPAVVGLILLAEPVMRILYRSFSDEQILMSARLIQISAINVVLLSVVQIYSSLLQALDRAKIPIIALGAGVAVKLILTFLLLPVLSIYGAAIASGLCFLTAGVIDGIYFRVLLGPNKKLLKNIGKITLASAIMGAAVFYIYRAIGNIYLAFFVSAFTGVLIFGLAALILRIFEINELASMPFSKKLIRLAKFFGAKESP